MTTTGHDQLHGTGSVDDGAADGGGPGLAPSAGPTFLPSVDFQAASEGVRDVALCFLGGGQVAGFGDPKGLGWVGRVMGRTSHPDVELTAYNLGVRGSTSADVVTRWRAETAPRWVGRGERRVVLQVGGADIAAGTTLARARLNLANVLDEATTTGIGAFVVGVTPTIDAETNDKLLDLADAQADVCARRGVPYVDCFRALSGHDQWLGDLVEAEDGSVHPGQAGYGLIAWLVLHNGWSDWLRIPTR